ncbi:heterokaryon incompatibility protein-domain-containing protein [Cladorrhinum samala]|uniref:Heterokaryon incompatibility protein-domain-containing protein n=1 Tax=Cladorrhinum samala TaxID=585594 RepID=A0AAV9HM84_9PEZI|nr:heterokaryon incompatibility protein-domain-containing protein [Cladorrhinum samala]
MTDNMFHYGRRLAPGEIRLLSLQPSTESSPSSALSFTLLTTFLDSPCPYLALSYAWGTQSDRFPIDVDSHSFLVTPSLYSALSHITPELWSLPIWIDAVCINQADEVEKTAQITRMSEVYHNSVKVIVFLGPSDPATDFAVEQLARVGKLVYDAGAMCLNEADMSRWPHFSHLADQPAERGKRLALRAFLEDLMEAEAGDEQRPPGVPSDAVLSLLQRPWFSRAWVIQELVMAPEADGGGGCVFAVGTRRISWEHLWGGHLFLSMWLAREAASIGDADTDEEALRRYGRYLRRTGNADALYTSRAAQTIGIRKKYLQGDLNRCLKALLMNLYTGDSAEPLGCREPEDKIRALRSLAEHGVFLDDIMVPGASWQEIYVALARHFYRKGDLDFLSLCRQRSSQSLPSWATDWSLHHRPPWLGYKTGDAAQLFDAGKGTAPRVREERSSDRVLCLEGWLIDTIEEVGEEWTAGLDEDFSWRSAGARIHDIYRFVSQSSRYPPEQHDEARWRIIVADKESNSMAQQVRATEENSKECHRRLQYATMTFPPGQGSFGTWFAPYRNTLLSLYGSRPFLGASGYVGLCPGTVKTGDAVFIPSGSHCPYVIRRSGDILDETWVLLGEAYVYGIMDGELDLGNKASESREFLIV